MEATTDLERAFERLLSDPEFATAVATDADAALAEFELSEEQAAALRADAVALDGDVVGFSFEKVQDLGGLLTPPLLPAGNGAHFQNRIGQNTKGPSYDDWTAGNWEALN